MADDKYSIELYISARNEAGTAIRGVTNDLQMLERQTGQNSQASQRLQGMLGGVGQAFKGFLTGIAFHEVTQLGEELYELGNQARIVGETFTELSGGAESAGTLLERLRGATGNIISDFSLMTAANQYLSMGLGETQEQVSGLIEMAVKLGGAMGHDATESINDFSLLLANESVLRLDTFGISSARVRERIDELLASGEALNRSEAFRLAVMEVGADSIERLGSAADAAETPLARMQVRLENIKDTLSTGFAIGVDTLLGLAEGLTIQLDYQERLMQRAAELANGGSALPAPPLPLELLSIFAPGAAAPYQAQRNALTPEVIAQAAALLQIERENAEVAARLADLERQRTNELRRQADLQVDQRENYGLALETADTIYSLETALEQMQDTRRGSVGGIELFTPEELERAEMMRDQVEALRDDVQQFAAMGLVTPEFVSEFERFAELSGVIAENAERGAAAYRNMTLGQALGEGVNANPLGTGLAGEFLNMARGLDLNPADFQAIEDAVLLGSGEITEASIALRDQVLPLLMQVQEQYGNGALVEAMSNLESFLREAATRGMPAEEVARLLQSGLPTGYGFTVGGGGSGGQITVNPGDTPGGVAARYGMTIDQVLAATGAGSVYTMQPGTYGAGGGMGGIFEIDPTTLDFFNTLPDNVNEAGAGMSNWSSDIGTALDSANELQTAINAMKDTELSMKVNITVNDPNGILPYITGGAALPTGVGVATMVRANGGRVPGADARAREVDPN